MSIKINKRFETVLKERPSDEKAIFLSVFIYFKKIADKKINCECNMHITFRI